MVAVLLVLSGCGTTPSGGGGVVLEVRVLSKTSYQALLRITLTNYSSVNFYFTRAEVTGEVCERGGTCVTYSGSLAVPVGEPLRPGEVRSSQDWVTIADAWIFIRWIEVVFEGRMGGTSVRVSSNRVYF